MNVPSLIQTQSVYTRHNTGTVSLQSLFNLINLYFIGVVLILGKCGHAIHY